MALKRGLSVVFVLGVASCGTPQRNFSDAARGGGGGSGGDSVGTGQSGSGTGGSSSSMSCSSNDTQSCYETPEGMSYGGKPPEGQTTCRLGVKKCNPDGTWAPCVGAIAPATADTCEPGNDANCNGIPNEGCSCSNGEERACGSDMGNCQQGKQVCSGDAWGECLGEVKASATDTCDANDDANCNGIPNEGCKCINGETKDCGSNIGPCKPGTLTCAGGNWPGDDQCMGGIRPALADTCDDGNDANCNNTPNEGCACTFVDPRDCGVNVGACKFGKQSCTNGALGGCVGGVNPTTNDKCFARDATNDTNCNGKSGDGCECVLSDGPKSGCGDSGCGQQLCDGATGAYKACSNINSNTRCNPNNSTQRQVCGPNGVFIAKECDSNQWCAGNGECKLRDGEVCNAGTDCATGTCTQFYTDADGDTYRANNTVSAFCGTAKAGYVVKSAANAQLDCNNGDNNEFVHPGAQEVCDGIDNDCDSLIDRDDDGMLQLGGGSQAKLLAAGYRPDIAWSGTNYGIVYEDNASEVRFAAVTQANAQSFVIKDVGMAAREATIGWNGTTFGIFAGKNGGAPAVNYFKGTTAGVVTTGSPASFGAGLLEGIFDMSVAAMGTGWYVTGSGIETTNYTSSAFGYAISANKQGTETAGLPANAGPLKVAVAGTTYGLVYYAYVGSSNEILFSPRNSDGTALKTPPIVLEASYGYTPAITATPAGGFAIAWVNDDTKNMILNVKEVTSDGTRVCGPITRTLGVHNPSIASVRSIVPTKVGYLISVVTPQGIELHETQSGCKFLSNPYLAVDTGSVDGPKLARGSAGYMLTWFNSGSIYTRALGPDVCN